MIQTHSNIIPKTKQTMSFQRFLQIDGLAGHGLKISKVWYLDG